jgi:hypothetical protein
MSDQLPPNQLWAAAINQMASVLNTPCLPPQRELCPFELLAPNLISADLISANLASKNLVGPINA